MSNFAGAVLAFERDQRRAPVVDVADAVAEVEATAVRVFEANLAADIELLLIGFGREFRRQGNGDSGDGNLRVT